MAQGQQLRFVDEVTGEVLRDMEEERRARQDAEARTEEERRARQEIETR